MAIGANEEISLSNLISPIGTVLANPRQRNPKTLVAGLNIPMSMSTDRGLQLVLKAIDERGNKSWYLEQSQVSYETVASTDSSLGQAPSFLDDICWCCTSPLSAL